MFQLHHDNPDRVLIRENESEWWGIESQEKSMELYVQNEKERGLWAQLSSPEKKKLFDTIGFVEGAIRPEKPKQYIGNTSV